MTSYEILVSRDGYGVFLHGSGNVVNDRAEGQLLQKCKGGEAHDQFTRALQSSSSCLMILSYSALKSSIESNKSFLLWITSSGVESGLDLD